MTVARKWRLAALESILLVGIVAVLLSRYDNPTIHTDESFHLLTARSLNADMGYPILGGRPYTRSSLYSQMVAWSMAIGGDNLTAARMPSLIAVALTVAALFLWVRSVAGRLAGWLAALLMAMSVFTLDIAHFCRFYAPHGLATFIMAIAMLSAARPGITLRRRIGLGAVALLSAMLAIHLQNTTVVAVGATLSFIGTELFLTVATDRRRSIRWRTTFAAAFIAFGLVCVAALLFSGIWDWAYRLLTWSPYWTDKSTSDAAAYHRELLTWYPLMWPLTPLAALAAIARCGRPAAYCAWFFALSFLIMSIGSVHAARYLFFAMPMWFALWGMAAGPMLATLHDRLRATVDRFALSPYARSAFAAACGIVLAGSVAFGMYNMPTYHRTLSVALGMAEVPFRNGDYLAVVRALRDAGVTLDSPSIPILGNPGVKARYYFPGHPVFLLGQSDRPSTDEHIPTAQRLRKVLEEHPHGLIVVERENWRDRRFVTDEMADLIESMTTRVELPARTGVHAFRWDRSIASRSESPTAP